MKVRHAFFLSVCCVACVAAADSLPKAPPEVGSRAARFANPPASARILPLHHTRQNNRKLNDKELRDLMLDGFGGYFGEADQTISYEVTPPVGYR